jgi:hypothetical protein
MKRLKSQSPRKTLSASCAAYRRFAIRGEIQVAPDNLKIN